jgi:hypothetical protein
MIENEKFVEEVNMVWGNDKSMVDYCHKKTFDVVELESGHIFTIEKPHIETRFCFGCGMYGTATDEEIGGAIEEKKEIHKFENFKRENINKSFGSLIDAINDGVGYAMMYERGKYMVGIVTENDYNFDWLQRNNKIVALMTETDRINIQDAVNKAIKRFEKRLETYWKKYQDTKLKTWTYIVD